MAETMRNEFQPDVAFPPGETLQEMIDVLGMTQAQLSERMGRPKKTINGIIKGDVAITSDTALQLERVLGIGASFWNNLEHKYQDYLARVKEKEALADEGEWLQEVPVRAMVKEGWIRGFKDKTQQLQAVLGFFGVASPEQWRNIWTDADIVFRRPRKSRFDLGTVSAWLRMGEIRAQNIDCAPYDVKRFKEALRRIRDLTDQPPEVFLPEVRRLYAEAGVAVVLVKQLPKTQTSGAAYWITPEKAVIQISLRYKTNDHFWFSFFHAAAHILLHGKRPIFMDGDRTTSKEGLEEEANQYAEDLLIPKAELQRLIASYPRSNRGHLRIESEAIARFADRIDIAPGIVVGRLQHEKRLLHSHCNRLKVTFEWKNSAQ